MNYLMIYLLIINAAGLLLMLADKRKAIKNRWRVPERTLFLTAMLGGSVGCILGMTLFRHKTKHLKFTVGLPAILILQCLLALYLAPRFL